MTADRGVQVLADRLVDEGLGLCTGVVGGGRSFDLADALRDGGVDVVPTATESAAVVIAAAAWRAGGRPALAVSIKGPGVGAALAGVTFAAMEHRPVLTASESFGSAAPAVGRHKWLDHDGLLAPLVRGFADRGPATERLPELIDAATGADSGPVHIELAEGSRWRLAPTPTSSADLHDVRRQIEGARRPVVVLGSGAPTWGWGSGAMELSVPTFTTAGAKGLVDETVPNAAGVFCGVGGTGSPEARLLAEADLVVGVGARDDEFLAVPTEGPAWVNADRLSPASLAELVTPWGAGLAADATAATRAILRRGGWWPGRVIEAIDDVTWNHTLVCDTGAFNTIAEHGWRAREGRRYESSGIARWMGTGLPLALGSVLAASRPTVCVVGDGGLPPMVAELRIAAARSLPLLVVLVNDGVFRSVRPSAPITSGDPRAQPKADHRAMAESLGIASTAADSPEAVQRELTQWSRDAPMFVVCPFDQEWDLGPVMEVRR